MTQITEKDYDKVCADYRSEFPYLNEGQYSSLCTAAGENCNEFTIYCPEALEMFVNSLGAFADQYSKQEILEII